MQDGLGFGRLQINRERALVAVPSQEVGTFGPAHPTVLEGHRAKEVTLTRSLDFDDVGAHVAQELSGERPLQEMAEIEDGYVLEGFGHERTSVVRPSPRRRRWRRPRSTS